MAVMPKLYRPPGSFKERQNGHNDTSSRTRSKKNSLARQLTWWTWRNWRRKYNIFFSGDGSCESNCPSKDLSGSQACEQKQALQNWILGIPELLQGLQTTRREFPHLNFSQIQAVFAEHWIWRLIPSTHLGLRMVKVRSSVMYIDVLGAWLKSFD